MGIGGGDLNPVRNSALSTSMSLGRAISRIPPECLRVLRRTARFVRQY